MLTNEIRNNIALRLVTNKIRATFDEPNSEKSSKVAKTVAKRTGISHMEIHRFHNAILNNNISNSFKPERAEQIALILIKSTLQAEGEMPNQKMRGQLSELANEFGVSFNDLLEFVREIYLEIINETLKPQSQA